MSLPIHEFLNLKNSWTVQQYIIAVPYVGIVGCVLYFMKQFYRVNNRTNEWAGTKKVGIAGML
jgi:hypothetical protein